MEQKMSNEEMVKEAVEEAKRAAQAEAETTEETESTEVSESTETVDTTEVVEDSTDDIMPQNDSTEAVQEIDSVYLDAANNVSYYYYGYSDGTAKIYYGAADTVECLAEAKIEDLVKFCFNFNCLEK